MKKIVRKILPLAVCAAALVVSSLHLGYPVRNNVSALLVENIQALASGESNTHYFCYGTGSLDCPNGSKAEIVRTNFSINNK